MPVQVGENLSVVQGKSFKEQAFSLFPRRSKYAGGAILQIKKDKTKIF